jgi:hypothetical protein
MIDGLSAGTMRQIRDRELTSPHIGSLHDFLKQWRGLAALTRRQLDDAGEGSGRCGVLECCPSPKEIRSRIEDALRALPPRARRELAALVQPLDEKIDRNTRTGLADLIQLDTCLTLRVPR